MQAAHFQWTAAKVWSLLDQNHQERENFHFVLFDESSTALSLVRDSNDAYLYAIVHHCLFETLSDVFMRNFLPKMKRIGIPVDTTKSIIDK